jgi:hypothetical protein
VRNLLLLDSVHVVDGLSFMSVRAAAALTSWAIVGFSCRHTSGFNGFDASSSYKYTHFMTKRVSSILILS